MDPSPRLDSSRRRLLVVEDEKALALLLVRRLEALGHEVLIAADGASACEVHAAQADAIALVVLDLTLPEVAGEEVLRRIRARSPEVPVVVTSGFAGQGVVDRLLCMSGVRFVAKPYRVGEILAVVHDLLL